MAFTNFGRHAREYERSCGGWPWAAGRAGDEWAHLVSSKSRNHWSAETLPGSSSFQPFGSPDTTWAKLGIETTVLRGDGSEPPCEPDCCISDERVSSVYSRGVLLLHTLSLFLCVQHRVSRWKGFPGSSAPLRWITCAMRGRLNPAWLKWWPAQSYRPVYLADRPHPRFCTCEDLIQRSALWWNARGAFSLALRRFSFQIGQIRTFHLPSWSPFDGRRRRSARASSDVTCLSSAREHRDAERPLHHW